MMAAGFQGHIKRSVSERYARRQPMKGFYLSVGATVGLVPSLREDAFPVSNHGAYGGFVARAAGAARLASAIARRRNTSSTSVKPILPLYGKTCLPHCFIFTIEVVKAFAFFIKDGWCQYVIAK